MAFHRCFLWDLFCPSLLQPRQWSVLTIQRRLDSGTATEFVLWPLHCQSDKNDEFEKDMWNAFKCIHFTLNNLNMTFLLGTFWTLVDKSESNSFDTKAKHGFELMFEAVIDWLAGILTKQSFLPHTSIYPVYPVWLLDGGYTLTLAQIHRLWLLRGVGCFRAEKFEESLEPTRGFHSFAGFRGCWLPGYAWVQAQVETWEFHCKNVRACETKQSSSFGASNPYMFTKCLYSIFP